MCGYAPHADRRENTPPLPITPDLMKDAIAMAKHHPQITEELAAFIQAQPMFFAATAAAEGRINVSPKGLAGCFQILDPMTVAFLNLTGSGNETAAHLLQDPRITLMFCSFSAKPMILRLYGKARAIHARDAEWPILDAHFPDYPGKRQIVTVAIGEIITSCGFGVPLMDMAGHRSTLTDWADRKGPEGIAQYWQDHNVVSFDGQPTGLFEDV